MGSIGIETTFKIKVQRRGVWDKHESLGVGEGFGCVLDLQTVQITRLLRLFTLSFWVENRYSSLS